MGAVVTAGLIVAKVKVEGRARDKYLQRGAAMPENLVDGELERLIAAGLVAEVPDEPQGEDSDTSGAPPAEGKPYEGVKLAELKAELEKRNADRAEEAKITPAEPGNKPEIIAALLADDAAQAESAPAGNRAGADAAGSAGAGAENAPTAATK